MIRTIFKISLLLLCFQFIPESSRSQYLKGDILIDFSAGASLQNLGTPDRMFTVSENTTAGFFVFDRFALGGTVGFEYFNQNSVETFFYQIGPSIRPYIKLNEDMFLFFSEQFLFAIAVQNAGFSSASEFAWANSLGPGVSFMLTNQVAMDFRFNYDLIGVQNQDLNHNLSFGVGFQIILAGDRSNPSGPKDPPTPEETDF